MGTRHGNAGPRSLSRMAWACAAIVGTSKNRVSGGWTPHVAATRKNSSVARSESPPRSKKSASTSTLSSFSSSHQIAASVFCSGVRGAAGSAGRDGAALSWPASATRSAIPMRCSLPVGPLGISSTIVTRFGTLKSARNRAANRRIFAGVAVASLRSTTAAATSSPRVACGIANVTAWATAG